MNNKYSEQEILTMEPVALALLLHEKCISKVSLSQELYAAGKQGEADQAAVEADEILEYLKEMVAADSASSQSLEVSGNLQRLYIWCIRENIRLRETEDASIANGIIRVLGNLRDGFKPQA